MDSTPLLQEERVRTVLGRIEAAWRLKIFEGLEDCFHPDAVILGPGYVEYARGRAACAGSYREFAENASVHAYSESSHMLRLWETLAVYTFAWEMEYQRSGSPSREAGTDQLVLQLLGDRWQVVWRFIQFQPVP